jgi:hypothetical protein
VEEKLTSALEVNWASSETLAANGETFANTARTVGDSSET